MRSYAHERAGSPELFGKITRDRGYIGYLLLKELHDNGPTGFTKLFWVLETSTDIMNDIIDWLTDKDMIIRRDGHVSEESKARRVYQITDRGTRYFTLLDKMYSILSV